MGYTEPDYWATCAQLILVLWLIIAVEMRLPRSPRFGNIRWPVVRALLSEWASGFLVLLTIAMGGYSLIGLVAAVLILQGEMQPTENWAGATGVAVTITGSIVLLRLIGAAVSDLTAQQHEDSD